MKLNALIVFLKFPHPGDVKTRLAKDVGPEQAAVLYSLFVEEVLRTIEVVPDGRKGNAPYDIFYYCHANASIEDYESWIPVKNIVFQSEGHLGEKIFNAFDDVFQQGYAHVVIIGTDCITLTKADILFAFTNLHNFDVVLGPSRDGGYYLLGLKQAQGALFENIAWSTEAVLQQTLKICKDRHFSVCQLKVKSDVDSIEDLRKTSFISFVKNT